MTRDDEDRSTWLRNDQEIRRDELLRLIEEDGGPVGLDLRGTTFKGEGTSDSYRENPIDLSGEALAPLAEAYRQANDGSDPPWLSGRGAISIWGAQLQGANLQRAQLQRAELSFAELQGAYLYSAQLQEADLTAAKLQEATLSDALLQGATLMDTELQGANLRYAQLQYVDLYDVESLEGVQLVRRASRSHADQTGNLGTTHRR